MFYDARAAPVFCSLHQSECGVTRPVRAPLPLPARGGHLFVIYYATCSSMHVPLLWPFPIGTDGRTDGRTRTDRLMMISRKSPLTASFAASALSRRAKSCSSVVVAVSLSEISPK